MDDPVVLIETNTDTGKPEGVGLFRDRLDAQFYVSMNLRSGTAYSLWTPAMGGMLKCDPLVLAYMHRDRMSGEDATLLAAATRSMLAADETP